MNFLTISDIKFAGTNMKLEMLAGYLKKRMDKINVTCEMKVRKDVIEIFQNSEKKLFMSTKTNYIPLKPGDARIKTKGRDYLDSERLTEAQLKALTKIFSDHLDQIHVSCSIKLYPSKDDMNSFIELRDVLCNNYITKWPVPTSFPLERK